MTNEAIITKIKKLLALSKSPNENEAIFALEKAMNLMMANDVNMDQIKEQTSSVVEVNVDPCLKMTTWKMRLLDGIAEANACYAFFRPYYTEKKTIGLTVIGEEFRVKLVQDFYEYLLKTIEREVKNHKGKGKEFINSFRVACATRIATRLRDRRKRMEAEGIPSENLTENIAAIVVRNNFTKAEEAISIYKENNGLKIKVKKTKIKINDGYYFGRNAGDRIGIDDQIKGSISTPKSLPSLN